MHINSALVFNKYVKKYIESGMKVLEIGPNGHPSSFCVAVCNSAVEWHTLDIIKDDRLNYVGTDPYTFPIPDNSFDVVSSAQVIEHVHKPWVWIKELARVCKPGGRVVTINPVSWPYHEAPVDCWRIYPEGMKTLYEDAGLHVELAEVATLESIRSRNALPGSGAVDPKVTKVKPGMKKKYFEAEEVTSLRSLVIKIFGWPVTYSVEGVTVGIK
jgi:ubiquinone/menaquinone biosynthesis C-methylase UbiE